jgi:hypothetical protein
MPFIGETSIRTGASGAGFSGNVIDDSVIFNTGDANTVKWTAGTPTSQDIWTASFWVKRAEQFATRQNIFGVSSGSHNGHISWAANDTLELYNDDAVLTQQKFTSSVHRDPTAWTHWCISFSGAGPDEVVFEKDGVVQSQTTGTDDTISGGAINKSGADLVIGDWLHPSGVPADMILAQFAFIDGTVYSASDFGEFDANGNWGAKSDADIQALTFGNNGIFLRNGTDIQAGTDTSGNSQSVTVTGLASSDVVSDSPTNSEDGTVANQAVLNSVWNGNTLSEGNLQAEGTGAYGRTIATFNLVDLIYFEVEFLSSSGGSADTQRTMCGIQKVGTDNYDDAAGTSNVGGYFIQPDGRTWEGSTTKQTTHAGGIDVFTANDRWCIAVRQSGSDIHLWFREDGAAWEGGGDPAADTTPSMTISNENIEDFAPAVHLFNSSDDVKCHFNADSWAQTAPTGFTALNSKTIADALAPDGDPDDYYVDVKDTEADVDATLATARSAFSNYVDIYKNEASAEGWVYRFSHDSSNEYIVSTTATYQALAALATGTDNHIGISINVDATKGVVAGSQAHTNGGGDTTITHNLGTTRYIALLFPRNGGEVLLHHPDFTTGELVHLTSVTAPSAIGTFHTFGENSAVIDDTHATDTYDYLFIAESDFFAIGTYTGNASADGPVFYAGGRPRHWAVIADNTNNHTFHNELIQSDANPHEDRLFLNTTNAVIVGTNGLDFLATGGKIKGTDNIINGNGEAYFWFSWLAFPVGGTTSAYQQSRAR